MRHAIIVTLITLGVGCTSSTSPIYVAKMRPLVPAGSGCEPAMNENLVITRLNLIDVAATPDYAVLADLEGATDYFQAQNQPPIQLSSGRVIASQGRDRLTITRAVLRYSSRPAIPGITASLTDTIPLTFPITPEATDLLLTVPLFGKNVQDQLAKLSPSNTDPPFQFTSSFELHGVTSGGFEFKTEPVALPMNLVKSEVTCPTADTRLVRYNNPSTAASCQFVGLGQRITPASCCNQLDASGNPSLDFSRLGCDVLP